MPKPLTVYVGYDQRERRAYEVAAASLERHASLPVRVVPLDQVRLRARGLYSRQWYPDDAGRPRDAIDHRPFSTEFAFTRFLVPLLHQVGAALFVDCDVLFRRDVVELLDLFDPRYAAQVVKHDHVPRNAVKMDGQAQEVYERKNWSSVVLWNADHHGNDRLTLECVNRRHGGWLHGFRWLADEEIGGLPFEWNWLEGASHPLEDPALVHFTNGGPWFPGYGDVAFADEWRSYER